ncbi:MAG: FAD binding domain-containing protein [bacterium]|nr:FAD binding domain-containing protein [bacterium]
MGISVKRCTALPELFQAVKASQPPYMYLAGGTDLMVLLKANLIPDSSWFDISDIPELHGIAVQDGSLVIGAGTPFDEIYTNSDVQKYAQALAEAAANVGGPQIRARGTIGGNIANGSPAADSLPALASLGAQVHLLSERGGRCVPIEGYALGNRRTVRAEDEIIHSISIPIRANIKGAWKALGARKAMAISKISLAVSAVLENGKFTYLRIGLGSVAATVKRAAEAEKVLLSGGWNCETLQEACRVIQTEISPIDDIRSTAEYRKAMSGILLGDAMQSLFGEAC